LATGVGREPFPKENSRFKIDRIVEFQPMIGYPARFQEKRDFLHAPIPNRDFHFRLDRTKCLGPHRRA
jgi:hypothetical protein